jgi:hypothetical protein
MKERLSLLRYKKTLKILLVVFSSLLAVFIVEVVLRVFHPIHYRKPPRPLPGNVWCDLLHRKSDIPGLSYELAPNREKKINWWTIRTNSHGMRGHEPLGGDKVSRIAVLGDSYTFGSGVNGEDTYSTRLEQILSQKTDDVRYDVLNFGVGGYSTRDEAIVFQHKARRWKPDLVILGYYFNDPEIEPIQPLHEYFQCTSWWQHFHVLRLIAKSYREYKIKRYGGGDYFRYLHYPNGRPWKSVVNGFAKIDELRREDNIPILVLIFPVMTGIQWKAYPYQDLHRQVSAAARSMGFDVIDLHDRFSKVEQKRLMVSPRDGHPNKLAHELVARVVSEWLQRTRDD